MRTPSPDASDLVRVQVPQRRRLVVGISGATGIAYGIEVLRCARAAGTGIE